MKYLLIIFSFMLFCSASCNKGISERGRKTDAQKAAGIVCDCFSPLLKLGKELETAKNAGDTETAQAIAKELNLETQQMENCMLEYTEKYEPRTKTEKEFENAVLASVKKQCPEVYKTIPK